MMSTLAIRIAALMGFLAVALGAFGAHGLENVLATNKTTEIWKTAVLYHFVHTLMLFMLGQKQPVRSGPWLSFLAGILLFSGSLYLMAVTNLRWLGAITPIGGVFFLIGWAWLFFTAGKKTG